MFFFCLIFCFVLAQALACVALKFIWFSFCAFCIVCNGVIIPIPFFFSLEKETDAKLSDINYNNDFEMPEYLFSLWV